MLCFYFLQQSIAIGIKLIVIKSNIRSRENVEFSVPKWIPVSNTALICQILMVGISMYGQNYDSGENGSYSDNAYVH